MLTIPTSLPVASPQPSTLPLEELIGEIAAGAALEIARALREFQTDGLSFEAKMRVGDLIARLFELRLCAGPIDDAARTRGARLLRERYGEDLDARTITVLIDVVIEVLRHVIAREMN